MFIIALLLSLVALHCVQACEASKGSLVSWALGFPQFWRACFPLMQRQRAEPLADREQSLLPLLGHRRLDQDPSGRVQIELNLVAGSELVKPWSLWSSWPQEDQSQSEAVEELEAHASPLIHPLSQQISRKPRVREPCVQPVSLAEERCGVRVDLRDLARRIVAALLIAASRHRQRKGGFGPPSIQCAGIAAAILCRSVFLECGPVHWRFEISNLEFVRRQAAELNRQFRVILEEQIAWYSGGTGLDWHQSRAAVWADKCWPANLLALLLLAGKRPSPQLQPCVHLFDSAFAEWRVCPRSCGTSLEESLLTSIQRGRKASQKRTWRLHRQLSCLEFAIGPGWPYPWLKIPRVGPPLPKLEWSGGLCVSRRFFWDTGNPILKEWVESSFDQSIEVSVI